MKSKNTDQLYDNLKRKGINVKKGDKKEFSSYSYYQVINAYKPLFINKVFDIDKIKIDVLSSYGLDEMLFIFNKEHLKGNTPTNIYKELCVKIADRYIDNSKSKTLAELEAIIKERKYILHVYDPSTQYRDFIRMYKFEHELRNLLLRYVLRIEEDIKAIFCSTLNELKADVNYLLDINNYTVSNDNSIKSLIKILQKNNNRHSNPILRKKTQNAIPPFWILINELSLGELTRTIKSIKYEVKNAVLDKLVVHFTSIGAPTLADREAILNLILDISVFRNDLAHNNPIFMYNISGQSLSRFPLIDYDKPRAKHDNLMAINRKKKQILEDLKRFWGSDSYNLVSETRFNINLSYMIYLISRITYKITPDTSFKHNIQRLFSKYRILDLGYWGNVNDCTLFTQKNDLDQDLVNQLNQILLTKVNGLDLSQLRKTVSQMKSDLSVIKSKLKASINKSLVKPDKRHDTIFPNISRYSQYTGIDKNYMQNVL